MACNGGIPDLRLDGHRRRCGIRKAWILVAALLVAAACSDGGGNADVDGDVEVDVGVEPGDDTGADPGTDPGVDPETEPDAIEDAVEEEIVEGEIVYTDEDPDVVIAEWEMYTLKLHGPHGSYGEMETYYVWFHPWSPNEVVLNTFDANAQVLADGGGLPLALEDGNPIEASSSSWVMAGEYIVLNRAGTGNWVGVTDRYLGLRFQVDGSWHYGWARLDIDATPTQFVVKDYAYQSAAGVGLAAGEGRP
jgi:hypothetical protein